MPYAGFAALLTENQQGYLLQQLTLRTLPSVLSLPRPR
jgi:hypothetical protein